MSMHGYLRRLRALVDEHGHAVQTVIGSHAYTVGLSDTLGFELLAIGLPATAGQGILNAVAARLATTAIPDGDNIDRIATLPLRLRAVSSDRAAPHMPMFASLFPGQPLRVRQLVWPDANGVFPGEPDYAHPLSQELSDLDSPAPHLH